MLYLDYDHKTRSFMGPRERYDDKINNTSLFWDLLAVLINYIACNKQQNVFHPQVLRLYREIKTNCDSRSEWCNYLRLFYHYIYKCDSGMSGKTNLSNVEKELCQISEQKYKNYLKKIKNLSYLTPKNLEKPPMLRTPKNKD